MFMSSREHCHYLTEELVACAITYLHARGDSVALQVLFKKLNMIHTSNSTVFGFRM